MARTPEFFRPFLQQFEPPASHTNAVEKKQRTPCIILLCGFPGVGKSTAAEIFREELQKMGSPVTLYTNDPIRDDLALHDPDFPNDKYSQDANMYLSRVIAKRVTDSISNGETVIVDGTHDKREKRQAIQEISTALGVPCHIIYITADEEIVKTRLKERDQNNQNIADYSVYVQKKAGFESIEGPYEILKSNGTRSTEELRENIIQLIPTLTTSEEYR